jgi:hypothetical protein
MKGEHDKACIRLAPMCLCNRCKRDVSSGNARPCCDEVAIFCPVVECPDYEPDDEEE